MSAQRKKSISTYILPILFCALLIVLAVVRNRQAERPVKALLQESEPLTLNEQAIENYLFSAGFFLRGEVLLDETGQEAGALAVDFNADGVKSMTLSFPLPTYYETGESSDILASLKAQHDEAARRGEDMFLALFDAIAATDGRVDARRERIPERKRVHGRIGQSQSGHDRFHLRENP